MPIPVPVTTIVLVAVFIPLILVTATDGRRRRGGWAWFALWAIPGFLAAFSTLSFAIGLLVLPFAVVATVGVSRFSAGAEMLGLLPGIGLMSLLIAALNIGEGSTLWTWSVAGIAFVAAGGLLYALGRYGRMQTRTLQPPCR